MVQDFVDLLAELLVDLGVMRSTARCPPCRRRPWERGLGDERLDALLGDLQPSSEA
jgi:hypothetical protein